MHLIHSGRHDEALDTLKHVVEIAQINRDRLFASGTVVTIITHHADQLGASEAELQSELKRYTMIALSCYDAADPGSQSEFRTGIADVDVLRQIVQDESVGNLIGQPAKSGCFIATAAYRTSRHDDVRVLRSFRDHVLMRSRLGRHLAAVYYNLPPPIADQVRRSSTLALFIRVVLLRPLTAMIRCFLR